MKNSNLKIVSDQRIKRSSANVENIILMHESTETNLLVRNGKIIATSKNTDHGKRIAFRIDRGINSFAMNIKKFTNLSLAN